MEVFALEAAEDAGALAALEAGLAVFVTAAVAALGSAAAFCM